MPPEIDSSRPAAPDSPRLPRREFLRATGAALGALVPLSSSALAIPSGMWRTQIGGPAHTRGRSHGVVARGTLRDVRALRPLLHARRRVAGPTDYGEWIRNNAKIPIDEYNTLLGRFNPTRFDADALARQAAAAGMKYLVITTKHHDGFCLWPTAQTRGACRTRRIVATSCAMSPTPAARTA
jgi:hypothetical protein